MPIDFEERDYEEYMAEQAYNDHMAEEGYAENLARDKPTIPLTPEQIAELPF